MVFVAFVLRGPVEGALGLPGLLDGILDLFPVLVELFPLFCDPAGIDLVFVVGPFVTYVLGVVVIIEAPAHAEVGRFMFVEGFFDLMNFFEKTLDFCHRGHRVPPHPCPLPRGERIKVRGQSGKLIPELLQPGKFLLKLRLPGLVLRQLVEVAVAPAL